MSKVNTITATVISFSLLAGASVSSFAATDQYQEQALIEVCKSAKSNSLFKYNKTAKSYHLKDKTIASKVMCNGEDIADFARTHGSYKVANKLEQSLQGKVGITDIASVSKINVNYSE